MLSFYKILQGNPTRNCLIKVGRNVWEKMVETSGGSKHLDTAHICSLILMRQVREQEICWIFLCQLTFQSADIMSSLCGVGVRVRVNNFFSKTTRPRDMLFFLKDTLSIEDEKLFKACKSVCSSVC